MAEKVPTQFSLSLGEVAELLSSKVIGDGSLVVSKLCPFEEPEQGGLTFLAEKHARAAHEMLRSISGKLNGVIVCDKLALEPGLVDVSVIPVKDPIEAMVRIMPRFYALPAPPKGVHPAAHVDPTARLGHEVCIGPFCYVGPQVVIADHVTLHSNVSLYRSARVGEGSTLHAGVVVREACEVGRFNVIQGGSVIGADGFGYIPDAEIGLRHVPQIGKVVLADYVEVGANTCIDRATLGTTRVGSGTKIDNLVQIGHNVQIGAHTLICGNVGIAGSSKIGSNVVIGGGSGIAGHIMIADGVRVAAMSGVTKNLTKKGDYGGYPAVEARLWRRQVAAAKQWGRKRGESDDQV